jgi:hypothetical protein
MRFKLILVFMVSMAVKVMLAQEIKFEDVATARKGEYTSYVASDGGIYKVGDRIKIGVPSSNKTFAFIFQGDGILLPITNLSAASSGTESEIKKISLGGNQRAGHTIVFRTKGYTGLSNYIILFENAITSGEVKGFGMSSDDALAELKKAKDKLDLGIITQGAYDTLKTDLVKYIK